MRVGFTSLSKNSVIPNYWILTETVKTDSEGKLTKIKET